MSSVAYQLFRRAIVERKQVTCLYAGQRRELYPIILGHTQGEEKLLAFQFSGTSTRGLPSSGNWRCFFLANVSDIELLRTFDFVGTSHLTRQTCVEDVEFDVNPDSPYIVKPAGGLRSNSNALPKPERGSIIRYAYLWADEERRGLEEGRKDRPALVVAITVVDRDARKRVYVLAVTHAKPQKKSDGVEIPATVKSQLKLDDSPSWIVTTEANAFVWPGPDIRPVPGRSPSTAIYGRIPESLLRKAVDSFVRNNERRMTKVVDRK